jgi:hypothetical protein
MNKKTSHTITKSRYIFGRQCLKYLWVAVNQRERIPEPDEATQFRFIEGYQIDRIAKTLWPDGIELNHDDFLKNIEETQKSLKKRVPLFEAGFQVEDISARADILLPNGKSVWDLIEIKSSTEVKDVHIEDVAFQLYCYKNAGIKIDSCFLMHVNNTHMRQGEIDPAGLLIKEDITANVEKILPEIAGYLVEIRAALGRNQCPAAAIGRNCADPYECPLMSECWGYLPEDNVFTLYRGGQKTTQLVNEGILSIKDIPYTFKLTERQAIQRECAKTGKTHFDKIQIGVFLDSLSYPLSYLDFETFATAIPQFNNISPYQSIPFQFSLHIQEKPDGKLTHRSFLATGDSDPRPEFLRTLLDSIPEYGSIVVYNQTFEKTILNTLADIFPEYSIRINAVLSRFIDLLTPFRDFHYYHPLQKGSASIKSVLPAITGKGYEGFAISDGLAASRAFIRMSFGKEYGSEVSIADKKKIRLNLGTYCGQDTEGMTWIVGELRKLARL